MLASQPIGVPCIYWLGSCVHCCISYTRYTRMRIGLHTNVYVYIITAMKGLIDRADGMG